MIMVVVFGVIALLVGAYLALDWWLAGRRSRRSLSVARDGHVGNANVDYDIIERQSQQHHGTPEL